MKNRVLTLFAVFFLGLSLTAKEEAITKNSSKLDPSSISPMVLKDMEGRFHNIDEVTNQGFPIVLVFWQTWCVPCKREAPALSKIAHEYSDKIKFFGIISGDDEDVDDRKVRKFAENFNLPYPQIRDRDLSLTNHFKVLGTPTIIIFGSESQVLFRGHKLPTDWSQYSKI